MKKYIIGWVLMWGMAMSLMAQNSAQADRLFELGDYAAAAEAYKKVLDKNPDDQQARLRLAESFVWLNSPQKARVHYAKIVRKKGVNPRVWFDYGRVLMSCRKYQEAIPWFEKFLEVKPQDAQANEMVAACQNLGAFSSEKAFFEIKRLPINSPEADFGAAIRGEELIFASARKRSMAKKDHVGQNVFSLYSAPYSGTPKLGEPTLFRKGQSRAHEATPAFSADGNVLYFTGNSEENQPVKGEESVVHLAVYQSEWNGETWSGAAPLSFNDPAFSFGHPCLSEDGKTMFFVSNRDGGFGNTDLYKVELQEGKWSEPENLGAAINTPGPEMFPWLDEGGNLYFATSGLGGLGGLDVFVAENQGGSYAAPTNVGAPVNSSFDDFGWIYDRKNNLGFFSSNRPGGAGQDDIYGFRKLISFYGLVRDADGNGVEGVKVDIRVGKSRDRVVSDETGKVTAGLLPGKNYSITLRKAGFETTTVEYSTAGMAPTDEQVLPITLPTTAE